MDMKKLLGIVDGNVETKILSEGVDEGCGMSPMGSSMPSTPPVSMSVNLNAQGVDNIKELLNLMRSAESGDHHDHSPMGMPMPAVGLDMPIKVTKIGGDDMKPAGSDGDRGMAQIRDLIAKADEPKEYSNSPEEAYSDVDSVTTDAGGGMQAPKDPADIRVKDPSGYAQAEEYANEPDEQYSDHNTMIKDLAGGLNREKRQYAKAQDGDNAMAVRESSIRRQLDAMWKEIKEGRADEVAPEPRDFSMTPDEKTTTGFKTNLKTADVANLQQHVGKILAIYSDNPADRAAGEKMWKNSDGRYGPETHALSDKAHAAIEKKIQTLELMIKNDPSMEKYMPALKKNKELLIKLGSKSDQSQGWR